MQPGSRRKAVVSPAGLWRWKQAKSERGDSAWNRAGEQPLPWSGQAAERPADRPAAGRAARRRSAGATKGISAADASGAGRKTSPRPSGKTASRRRQAPRADRAGCPGVVGGGGGLGRVDQRDGEAWLAGDGQAGHGHAVFKAGRRSLGLERLRAHRGKEHGIQRQRRRARAPRPDGPDGAGQNCRRRRRRAWPAGGADSISIVSRALMPAATQGPLVASNSRRCAI
jgi:hypothetical protein